MLYRLIATLSCVVMLLSASMGCSNKEAGGSTEEVPTVSLPQSIIDEAVAQSLDARTWGINLAKVNVDYEPGVRVEAAIVLHNGDDVERLVKIRYRPTYTPTVDAETRIIYDPSPIQASGWVTIDITELRMEKMDTVVIPVYLLVPTNQVDLPPYWEFGVAASGTSIRQYQYVVKVNTLATVPVSIDAPDLGTIPDTRLELLLPQPLLDNSLGAVLMITSSIEESPRVVGYNPSTRVLIIEDLKPSADRELSITYEYGEPVVIDYNQRWLVRMAT